MSPPPPNAAFGVCVLGHAQRSPGAQFCYQCGAPIAQPAVQSDAATDEQPDEPPSAPPAMPQGPTLNDRYQVLSEIGRGGMGSVVYRVQDLQNPDHILAVKEMDEVKLAQDPTNSKEDIEQLVIAFKREADMLNRLQHPNIVQVYEYFNDGTKHYMAMDLVDGRTLGDLLETSPDGFPEVRVLPWAEQLCAALDYLHNLTPPVIYRDMKPDNVMIENATNRVVMIDFGIARQYKGGKKKQDTIKFGTLGYAAPEQYGTHGTETSPASDVYSLAAMLYQLLTGDDPADNPLAFFVKSKLRHPAVGSSQRVADALEHALQTEIAKRCQSMDEFAQDLTGHALEKPEPIEEAGEEIEELVEEPLQLPLAEPEPQPVEIRRSVHLSHKQLHLGRIRKRSSKPPEKPFTVAIPGGGRVPLLAQAPWLRLSQASIADNQSVTVTVSPPDLPIAHFEWRAPKPLAAVGKFLLKLWWLSIPTLAGLCFVPWGGAAIVLALVALLSVQIGMSMVSWFLRRIIVRTATLQGDVCVGSGSDQRTLNVSCKVVPPLLNRVIGWIGLIVAFAVVLLVLAIGVLLLIEYVFPEWNYWLEMNVW